MEFGDQAVAPAGSGFFCGEESDRMRFYREKRSI
jgi:hypothetical protein